ncbi:hypothetical protein SAMN04487950_2863 [Halogranum rubrum]|uniref:ArsR family transcriptional regulator n=1 Tax=Halogranum rubrum TaxID=553466 RepID=A0A1I4FYN1_9EURY|nr:hypothetical protein [Halogranum rubrum]SFL21851.1 hypothetical protein SAMN04487950_2863 [Halogranum rubrum]
MGSDSNIEEDTFQIRVSQGDVTVEVSGNREFVEKRFDDLQQTYLQSDGDQELVQMEQSTPRKPISLGELYTTATISYKRDAALLVGWYLESVEGQEDFSKSELQNRALKAKVELGKNLSRDLSTLVENGLLREVGRRDGEKTYYLTRTGESYADEELNVEERSE